MPTYVYECKKCGQRFEIMQSISDPPRRRCPECRGAVRRVLMPGGGLIFKGSGFYITDYRNKENKARAAREGKLTDEAGVTGGGQDTAKDGSAKETQKSESSERPRRSEKSEKSEKSERSEKSGKSPGSVTSDKSDRSGKSSRS